MLRESEAPRAPTIGRDDPVELALMKLRPGDIIYAEKGKYGGKVAVLTTAHRKGGMRVSGLTMRRDPIALSAPDFEHPPKALGHIDLPGDFAPNRHDFQKEVVHRLEKAETKPFPRPGRRRRAAEQIIDHPVEQDPDLAARMKAAVQAERVAREIDELRMRITGRTSSIARDFDRVLRILDSWGYVDGWKLTEAGEILARTFHESDLLIVECLRRGLFDDLEPAHLAGLVSVFVYEHRSADPPPAPWFPTATVKKRWREIADISDELHAVEEDAGLSMHRSPDPTFIAIAFAWAAGEGFAEVVEAEELSGGDFVRTTKQLIDVLRQLALVSPRRETRKAADAAAHKLFRGVVAASSAVDVEVDDDVPVEIDPPDPHPRPLRDDPEG
jgi:ATP-dependent RNA helicase HelY